MNKTLIVFLTSLLFTCSNKSELDSIVEKNSNLKPFVDSLKATAPIYKKCEQCKLSGLYEKKIIGFTDRYPPKGNYEKKEIEIGIFEYDTYTILDSITDKRTNGKIYICYFNEKQKEKFIEFLPFYANRITHYKQLFQAKYINNTVIISIYRFSNTYYSNFS